MIAKFVPSVTKAKCSVFLSNAFLPKATKGSFTFNM